MFYMQEKIWARGTLSPRGLREKLGSSSAPETEGGCVVGSRGSCRWWVGIVCLGSQYSAFLGMVERPLFQEYPSILQVECLCISDTSAGPGLGSSVPAARVLSGGSGCWKLQVRARCSRTRVHAPLTVVSRFFLSNSIQAADHLCGWRSPGSGQPGVWSPVQEHSLGVQVSTFVRFWKRQSLSHLLGEREGSDVADLASFGQSSVWWKQSSVLPPLWSCHL